MSDRSDSANGGSTRRDFLKTTAVAGLAAGLGVVANAHAADNDTIKVGIIGCGGRGTGAGYNVLSAAKGVEIYALGDAFEDRLNGCLGELQKQEGRDRKIRDLGNRVDVPEGRQFVGLDAYQKVLDSGVNYVILATPPGFRPIHL